MDSGFARRAPRNDDDKVRPTRRYLAFAFDCDNIEENRFQRSATLRKRSMAYQHIEVQPIAGACGAEIHGVDLSKPMKSAVFDEIYDAWLQNQVVFFRDQDITPEQQIKFAKKWGGIYQHPYVKGLAKYPEILEIKKTPTDTYTFGGRWHSDQMFAPRPVKATMLYAKETPPYGGDTQYANMYKAYEALSPGMKKMLEGVKALNVGDGNRRNVGSANYGSRAARYTKGSAQLKKPPKGFKTRSEHPLVRTHPETKRKGLYIGVHTQNLVGFDDAESDLIIDMLMEHCRKPEFVARFSWEPGSMAIWDNRCLQHQAISDYAGFGRLMHRITIKGDKPV
jgi:taurine dioxygenase